MNEFKLIQHIDENTITLTLPDEFKGKSVEIIINEIPESEEEKRKKLQEILLNAPTWTDEEYQEYLEARDHFSQWGKV